MQSSLLSGGESHAPVRWPSNWCWAPGSRSRCRSKLPAAAEGLPSPAAGPAAGKGPDIEPIVLRVPADCFYVRAGSFPNFLWFRHRLEVSRGNVRNLLLEGVDRLRAELALRGPDRTEGIGVGGRAGASGHCRRGDHRHRYLSARCASDGILFQARNNFALASDIQRQRLGAQQATAGATEEKLTIGGKEVSFVSATPDNGLRLVLRGRRRLPPGVNEPVSRSSSSWPRVAAAGAREQRVRSFARCGPTCRWWRRRHGVCLSVERVLSQPALAALSGGTAAAADLVGRDGTGRTGAAAGPGWRTALLGETAANRSTSSIAAYMLPPGFGRQADGSRLEMVDGTLARHGPRGAGGIRAGARRRRWGGSRGAKQRRISR